MACLEGVVDLADAVAEDVGEAQQDRQLDAAFLELIDELLEVDRLLGRLVRLDGDVAVLVDGEVALAPVADAVGVHCVGNFPLFHPLGLQALGHRRILLRGAVRSHLTPLRKRQHRRLSQRVPSSI